MSKKISSIIIIFFTILYVTVTLYINGYNVVEMGSIKTRQVLNSIIRFNIGSIVGHENNLKIDYEDVKQVSDVNTKINKETVSKVYKPNIIRLSKQSRKVKLDSIHQSETELLKSILDKTPIDIGSVVKEESKENSTSNNNATKAIDNRISGNNDLESTEDTPVFSTSVKYELTDSDKERILTAAKKLSPIDYEKINTYIKYVSDSNAKSAVNLLRDRLSDKDFQKIKDISVKLNKK